MDKQSGPFHERLQTDLVNETYIWVITCDSKESTCFANSPSFAKHSGAH